MKPHIKTSLAPGSRVVTEYLTKAGLLPYLEKLGFYLAGYGCTTCIGNSGPLRRSRSRRRSSRTIWCARRCCRATAISRRASTPTSRPISLPVAAAGGGLCDRRHGAERPDAPSRSARARTARPSTSATSGRRTTKSQALMKLAMDPQTFRRLYGDLTEDEPAVERHRRSVRPGL